MKSAGVGLVLLGGWIVFLEFSLTQRYQLRLIRDLAAALKQLSGEIRWKLQPIPSAVMSLGSRGISGDLFGKVSLLLEGGTALQDAWQIAFSDLTPEAREIMLDVEWGGDVSRQEGSILYAAQRMTELGESKRETLHQREKLCVAAALSVSGLLVLILI